MFKYIAMVFAGACSFGILSTFVKLAYREGYSAAELTFSQSLICMIVLWVWAILTASGRKQKAMIAYVPPPVSDGASVAERMSTGNLSGGSESGQAGHTEEGQSVKPASSRTAKSAAWLSLLLSGAAMGFTTLVYYLSVLYIPASLAVVILMQFTWMGILLEWALYRKRPGSAQFMIVLVILAGTVMASGLSNLHTGALPLKGILLALASALLYAIYIVGNSKVIPQVSFLKKSAIIMTGYMLGILVTNARELFLHGHFGPGLLKWILFFGTFGTIIPQTLFAKGIPRVGAGMSAIIMTVELPVAVVAAHLVLDEPVGFLQWIGVIVMLVAMAGMKMRKKKVDGVV